METEFVGEYGRWCDYYVCIRCKGELSTSDALGGCHHCGHHVDGRAKTEKRFKRWHRVRPLRWYERLFELRGPGQWEDKELTEATQQFPASEINECFAQAVAMMTAERTRQVTKEGYTTAHDDEHIHGEIAQAATVYYYCVDRANYLLRLIAKHHVPITWPWEESSFKPWDEEHSIHFPRLDKLRCLVKSAALLEAEKGRLERLQQQVLWSLAQHIKDEAQSTVSDQQGCYTPPPNAIPPAP